LEQAQSKAPAEEIMGPLSQLRQKNTAIKYSTKELKTQSKWKAQGHKIPRNGLYKTYKKGPRNKFSQKLQQTNSLTKPTC
jgi:hypothetical protein